MFDFYKWLEDTMCENGWSESQLADNLGITRQAVSQYMHGKRYPMLYSFSQMLEKLGKRMVIEDAK